MSKEKEATITAPKENPAEVLGGLIKEYQEKGNNAAAALLESVQERAEKTKKYFVISGIALGGLVGTTSPLIFVESLGGVPIEFKLLDAYGFSTTLVFSAIGGTLCCYCLGHGIGTVLANRIREKAIEKIRIANQPEQASLEGPKNV